VGVTVIDLLDLVLWACRRGAAPLDALSAAWGAQPHPEWPKGWAGTVAKEAASRGEPWAPLGTALADLGTIVVRQGAGAGTKNATDGDGLG
jgi:hypothetical protein